MKFGELLNSQQLSEWRQHYFEYEVAKKMLYHFKENSPSKDEDSPEYAIAFRSFEKTFFEFTSRELTKINTFFLEKLNESKRKFASLNTKLQEYLLYQQKRRSATSNTRKRLRNLVAKSKDIHDFKVAFSAFYYTIVVLKNYQQLNVTAFRKILKKHDKIIDTTDGMRWRESAVLSMEFATTKAVDELAADVEDVVTEKLEHGDHKRAIKMLRNAPVGQQPVNPWVLFRIGMWCGYVLFVSFVIVILLPWFNCDVGVKGCWRHFDLAANVTAGDLLSASKDTFWVMTIRLFRGALLVALMLILFGINVHGWRSAGISHIHLFDLDIRDCVQAATFIELGLVMLAATTFSLLVWLMQFYIGYVFNLPFMVARLFFLCYFATVLLLFLNPVPVFLYKTRYWFIKSLLRIATAPFQRVGFADYFLAEQLISLLPVFQDYAYIGCFAWFGFRPSPSTTDICNKELSLVYGLSGCLPYWFRFAQCLRVFRDSSFNLKHPHLTNALKYSIAFVVILVRSLDPLIVQTTYLQSFSSTSNGTSVKQQVSKPAVPDLNPYYYFVILCLGMLVVSYWFWWDTKQDWKLLNMADVDNRFLRGQLLYRHSWYYYSIVVIDFILLTIYWAMQLFDHLRLNGNRTYALELWVTLVAIGEVFRRFLWNFIRLERESIYNPVKFQATSNLPSIHHYTLRPLVNDEIEVIDKMMTLENGANLVRKSNRKTPTNDDFQL